MSKDSIAKLVTLNNCVDLLMTKLFTKKDELRRRENSCGKYHDVRAMNRLRTEIANLAKRLTMAEKLQDHAILEK